MQITLHRLVWGTTILTAVLANSAQAQSAGRLMFISVPTFTTIRVATTATIPDGGGGLLGGYSRASEGRTEYGAPIVGKMPYLGRTVRNVGFGRTIVKGKVIGSVRIIDLREEEYRQTGVRSP
jgi:hypothetical protein